MIPTGLGLRNTSKHSQKPFSSQHSLRLWHQMQKDNKFFSDSSDWRHNIEQRFKVAEKWHMKQILSWQHCQCMSPSWSTDNSHDSHHERELKSSEPAYIRICRTPSSPITETLYTLLLSFRKSNLIQPQKHSENSVCLASKCLASVAENK